MVRKRWTQLDLGIHEDNVREYARQKALREAQEVARASAAEQGKPKTVRVKKK